MTSAGRIALAGICLLGVVVAQACLHVPHELGIGGYGRLVVFVVGWAVAGAIYAVAISISLRANERGVVALVLIFAAALRIAPLLSPPFLSTDVYRYVWDGRVQNAGINPYCCIPSAPELEKQRETAIYPFINRSDYAPTIYPPVAQMVFAVVARLSETVFAMKVAMVLAEAVAIATMMTLLGMAGMPRARVLIYAWNPVVIWEYSGNAHIDALAIAFTGLTLLAAARGRPSIAGVALAAATLTKFLPVVIGPAVWAASLTGRRRWSVLPLCFIATIVGAYACYASVGLRVFGFIGGYSQEEGLRDGGGLYVLQLLSNLVAIPPWGAKVWLAIMAIGLAGISARVIAKGEQSVAAMGADALLLSTVTIVAISPHYAWYFGGLAYLSCLAAWPSVIWLTIACAAVYLDTTHANSGWANLLYGPFAILAVRDILGFRASART